MSENKDSTHKLKTFTKAEKILPSKEMWYDLIWIQNCNCKVYTFQALSIYIFDDIRKNICPTADWLLF